MSQQLRKVVKLTLLIPIKSLDSSVPDHHCEARHGSPDYDTDPAIRGLHRTAGKTKPGTVSTVMPEAGSFPDKRPTKKLPKCHHGWCMDRENATGSPPSITTLSSPPFAQEPLFEGKLCEHTTKTATRRHTQCMFKHTTRHPTTITWYTAHTTAPQPSKNCTRGDMRREDSQPTETQYCLPSRHVQKSNVAVSK